MLHKIRLLDHEATQVEHHFMEPSQNRLAMDRALLVIARMPHNPNRQLPPPGPKYIKLLGKEGALRPMNVPGPYDFFFIGEHNDGLFIAFTDEVAADYFTRMRYHVTRYSIKGGDADRLRVMDGDMTVLDVQMGPGGPLHPESASAARERPWFFSGSPFGQEIIQLAKDRKVI